MDPSSSLQRRSAQRDGFRWRDVDAFLFDIDGTLLNSRDGVHYHAFHNAVREIFGVSSKIDGVPVHGNTDIGILRAVLERENVTADEIARRMPQMLAHMCEEVQRNAAEMRPEVCPSVAELVAELNGAGKLLGIVSGNLETIGWLKLEASGLRRYFSIGSFSDRNEKREDIFRYALGEVRRRLGDGARVCIVGDTPADIRAARAADTPVIAVATGIYSVEQLAAEGPDVCVSCCTELLGQVRNCGTAELPNLDTI
jgi:phosphoglycolate phosphatase-like HAD superfamily hydrolase